MIKTIKGKTIKKKKIENSSKDSNKPSSKPLSKKPSSKKPSKKPSSKKRVKEEDVQEEVQEEDFEEEVKEDFGGDNEVVIVCEQQPRTNMKTIKMAAQITFFYGMRKLENTSENYKINKIVGYSAKNKTKYYILGKDEEPIPERIMKLKSPYARRKQISIEHTKRILLKRPNEKEFMEFFLKHKKKDDLADCYLQALSYISKYGKNIKKGTVLLSIDPGTINFSYCLVDTETEKIIEWSVDSIVDNMRHSDEYNAMALYKHLLKKNIIRKRELLEGGASKV